MTMTDDLIERALGIRLGSSPVYTAKDLLVDCYKDKPHVIQDCTWDLRTLPFQQAARDLIYRLPYVASMAGLFVHHFDKNSTYLSACSATDTGIGDPVHFEHGNVIPGCPGLYRVVWVDTEKRRAIPIIEEGQQWINNDLLIFARSRGYQISIKEAYVWADYDRILGSRTPRRNWALRLWNARQMLKLQDAGAYQQMKIIALVGVGSFATSQAKYSGIHLIHPNWWCDVVNRARVNMLANIEKYSKVAGLPILCYCDGLWFVSRDPNPRSAVPGILDRMNELGGYKWVNSFLLSQEVMEYSSHMAPGELCTFYNRLGEDHHG